MSETISEFSVALPWQEEAPTSIVLSPPAKNYELWTADKNFITENNSSDLATSYDVWSDLWDKIKEAMDSVKDAVKEWADYVYSGGNKIISDFVDGATILLETKLTGLDFSGEDFRFYSDSGALVLEDIKNKIVDFRDELGEAVAKAYAALNEGEIDGRYIDAFEYIVGSALGANTIYAGVGGALLWGYVGNHADNLIGNSGEDIFFVGKNEGNDRVENSSSADTVNLYNVLLSDIISTSESNGKIDLTLNTGNIISVLSNEVLSSKFSLADGSAYRYNHSEKTWQSA